MRYLLLLLTSFLFIGGCSDNKVEDHVWKDKTDTIGIAKEASEAMKNATQLQKQQLDEQLNKSK